MKHLRYFPTLNGYINAKAEQKLNYPSVSVVNDDGTISVIIDKEEPTPEPHDYSQDYLTFEAIEDGTFKFSNAIAYSIDDGATWTILSANTASPSIAAGSKIMWKGNLTPQQYSGIGTFSATHNFNVYGNVMSLLYGDNFVGQISLEDKAFAFSGLFNNNTKVVSALNLILPATTLATECYGYMFQDCSNLTTAPELPAVTLADYCYYYMFWGCTSLTATPVLSATTLASSCYGYMFQGCTSLTTAPALPATTLTGYCYYGMFNNCSSLTTAPVLPATTLAGSCYCSMFSNCTSLATAPELPATTLADSCYYSMFRDCISLNYIKMLATDISASDALSDWVSGVSSTGTFVKNSAATWDVTGVHGIPSGWTVIEV